MNPHDLTGMHLWIKPKGDAPAAVDHVVLVADHSVKHTPDRRVAVDPAPVERKLDHPKPSDKDLSGHRAHPDAPRVENGKP